MLHVFTQHDSLCVLKAYRGVSIFREVQNVNMLILTSEIVSLLIQLNLM